MVSSIRIKETQYQLVHGNPLQVERESGGGCLATSPGSSLGSSHRENQRILSCPCCLGLLIMVIYRLPDFLWGVMLLQGMMMMNILLYFILVFGGTYWVQDPCIQSTVDWGR